MKFDRPCEGSVYIHRETGARLIVGCVSDDDVSVICYRPKEESDNDLELIWSYEVFVAAFELEELTTSGELFQ